MLKISAQLMQSRSFLAISSCAALFCLTAQQLKINPNKAVALRQAVLTMRRQHPEPHHWAILNLISEAE